MYAIRSYYDESWANWSWELTIVVDSEPDAQPGAHAHLLGGEERFENPAAHGFLHARPVVLDLV